MNLDIDTSKAQILVVVTVHDHYVGYLGHCLDSILAQPRKPAEIIVVHNGDGREIAKATVESYTKFVGAPPMRFHSMDTTNVSEKRNWAAAQTRSEFILFVDADNYLDADYLQPMAEAMRDPRVAIAYPDIDYFGRWNGLRKGTLETFDRDQLTRGNYIESCSLVRRLAFEQVGGWDPNVKTLMDWHLWLRITGRGWRAAKAPVTLHYRLHPSNMSATDPDRTASSIASRNAACPLALVTPFCGRRWSLTRYIDWLEAQAYPHDHIHLVFIDNSCDEAFGRTLREWLAKCDYASTAYYPLPVPFEDRLRQAGVPPDLIECEGNGVASTAEHADTDVRGRLLRQRAVACAVAENMQLAKRVLWQDDVFFLEDDVEPRLDAIAALRNQLWPGDVAGVSGVVKGRFHKEALAYRITSTQPLHMERVVRPADGDPHRVESIHATGFGCLLMRTAALRNIVFRPLPEDGQRWLGTDFAMCRDLHRQGWTFKMHWDAVCRHHQADGTWL